MSYLFSEQLYFWKHYTLLCCHPSLVYPVNIKQGSKQTTSNQKNNHPDPESKQLLASNIFIGHLFTHTPQITTKTRLKNEGRTK